MPPDDLGCNALKHLEADDESFGPKWSVTDESLILPRCGSNILGPTVNDILVQRCESPLISRREDLHSVFP